MGASVLVAVTAGGACSRDPGEHFVETLELEGNWATIKYRAEGHCDESGEFTGKRHTWFDFEGPPARTNYRVQPFLNGRLHGVGKKVYPGMLVLRSHRHGCIHGLSATFSRDGHLLDRRRNREYDHTWTRESWYPDGTPRTSATFWKEALDDVLVTWWPGGAIQQRVLFDRGALHGDAWWWHENGEVQMHGTYRRDAKNGRFWIWDENGVVRKRQRYCDGTPCGVWLRFDDRGVSTVLDDAEMTPLVDIETTPAGQARPSDNNDKDDNFDQRVLVGCGNLWTEV